MELRIDNITDNDIFISWDKVKDATSYRLLWKDRKRESMLKKTLIETTDLKAVFHKMPRIPYYLTVQALRDGEILEESKELKTPIQKVLHPQLEKINRGLVAVSTGNCIFISWRLFKDEVTGSSDTGLTGCDFALCKNGRLLAYVTDSTNYLDKEGTKDDMYSVIPYESGNEPSEEDINKKLKDSPKVKAWDSGQNYLDIPLRIPDGGTTPLGESYTYHANDISIGDVDGDGEYEYIVKWDPTNSKDVSQKGYTGKVFLDCYKLDGRILWRLDMGVNIRAGAHYTQFMVYDFNADGTAEMAVKTAPGTCMHFYDSEGREVKKAFITIPKEDIQKGISNDDNYVASSKDYFDHLANVFKNWQSHPEVVNGHWPATLEECFNIEPRYKYPLSDSDAKELADFFIKEYAPSRSAKNKLDEFDGFIFKGPEYLTMFGGDGRELETIPFKYGRDDDGLMWGDYSMPRIEPCNRVDRFLSGVAYLDGERPYLIICRGYYTRTTMVAYDFFENRFREKWSIDSGYVRMENPFNDNPHELMGSDPVYGVIAGQGNHSLSTADVDGDGYQEIIYGAACIDQDGSVLYSSYDYLPNGIYAKLGHGDAMHVANID
uniref:rhamnogalacturonan lyase family protein n=1 Tax=Butyrivibrio sp. TaxID=28121 RepID=UPI0025D82BB4